MRRWDRLLGILLQLGGGVTVSAVTLAARFEVSLRTTPALLGLFSLVTLFAHPHPSVSPGQIRQAAWYRKRAPTFADALALVRQEIWAHETFCMSGDDAEMVKVPRVLIERLTETLCYVA